MPLRVNNDPNVSADSIQLLPFISLQNESYHPMIFTLQHLFPNYSQMCVTDKLMYDAVNNVMRSTGTQGMAIKTKNDNAVLQFATEATSTSANGAVIKLDQANTKIQFQVDSGFKEVFLDTNKMRFEDVRIEQNNTSVIANGRLISFGNNAGAFQIYYSNDDGSSFQYPLKINRTSGSNTPTNWLMQGSKYSFKNSTGTTELVTIDSTNGKVGIGNTNPVAKLHVTGKCQGAFNIDANGGFYMTWNTAGSALGGGTHYANQAGIMCDATIGCHMVVVGYDITYTSDRRVKKDVRDIDDNECLLLIRQIKPRKYKYIDNISRTDSDVYGFIAQEVQEVAPYMVNAKTEDYLPNIYEKSNYDKYNNTITLKYNKTINDFDFKTNDNGELIQSIKLIRLDNDEFIFTKITSIIDSKTFVIEDTIENYELNEVFVFGGITNDFCKLNKNALYTVNLAAVQEIDRIQQTLKSKITSLEQEIESIKAHLNL